jgi:hypothetical protein
MSRRSSSWNEPYYARLGLKKVDRAEAGPDHLEILLAEVRAGHDPAAVASWQCRWNDPLVLRKHLMHAPDLEVRLFSKAERSTCQRIAALAALSS